jgi:hypothetical protein
MVVFNLPQLCTARLLTRQRFDAPLSLGADNLGLRLGVASTGFDILARNDYDSHNPRWHSLISCGHHCSAIDVNSFNGEPHMATVDAFRGRS